MEKFDKFMYINSLFLLVFPVILFFVGFLKYIFSIPFIALTLFLVYRAIKNYSYEEIRLSKKIFVVSCIVVFAWLLFSGIGDFSFQNHDFSFRHAILRDLINYNWPVIYKDYGLVYYLSYFLPAALVGKIFTYKIANIFMFIYSYMCLISILYLVNRYLKKSSYHIIIFFVLFSGLDALCSIDNVFSFTHLEWWNGIFQYSSNTTLLYWCFNQTIPIWLITSLLINVRNRNSMLFISALSFFYSPYATIGLIPIVFYIFIRNLKTLDIGILSWEVLFCIFVFIVLGLYYTSGNGTFVNGFIFQFVNNKIIIIYVIFILIEVAFYFILTFRNNKKNPLYFVVMIELLLIPFYLMSPANDFCMRASAPCLFLLMVYFIKYIDSKKHHKKMLVYILLFISFITPIHEISRSIYHTLNDSKKIYISDQVWSVGNPKMEKALVKRQFYGNINSFYYRYLSK